MSNIGLFEQVRELNLPRGKYALFGSAPIGVRGLRECHDIDIIVTEDIFNEYKEKFCWNIVKTQKSIYLEKDNIELWKEWGPDYFSSDMWNIKRLIDEAEIINNLPFVKLKEVLKSKTLLGEILKRNKDLEDVKIINEFLNT